MIEYSKMMPRMLSGKMLLNALQVIPEYSANVTEAKTSERLINLSAIYQLYLPSGMSVEIYNKLYMATAMSLQKKTLKLMIEQRNSNFSGIQSGEYRGIIGGADSFSILGTSGIGKSSAIERAARLISGGGIIETQKPLMKIIPCLSVQCPYDCSPKGMLLEILRIVDSQLSTNYYTRSQRAGVTTDILIGTVSQVSINHIGLQINEEKYFMIRDGIPVTVKKPNGQTEEKKAIVIDFNNPDNNYFLAVKELKIHGDLYRRRTDIVGFVNGLPLLFIELKRNDVDVENAYTDNYTDYQDTIPFLLYYNAFLMLSNGMEAKVGTLGSKYEFFHEWKRLHEDDEGNVALETMLRGICKKENFLDL